MEQKIEILIVIEKEMISFHVHCQYECTAKARPTDLLFDGSGVSIYQLPGEIKLTAWVGRCAWIYDYIILLKGSGKFPVICGDV